MKITWLGHAAFLLETNELRIVNDPYGTSDERIGYQPINMPADIVTISHDHFDHNHIEGLTGNPEIVKSGGRKTIKGIQMHFKTASLDFPIASVDGFLEGKKNVKHLKRASFEITKQELPEETQIMVLDHLL